MSSSPSLLAAFGFNPRSVATVPGLKAVGKRSVQHSMLNRRSVYDLPRTPTPNPRTSSDTILAKAFVAVLAVM